MKIVILEGNAVNPGDLSWDAFKDFGTVTVYPRTAPEEAVERIGDAEIIFINKFPVTAQLLDRCPSIKLICVLATGYNVVDCQAAKERGIIVCNVPAYGTAAVAQFTVSLLLELCHRIGHHNKAVHQGNWTTCPDFCFWDTPQMELAGKTLGIIGYGRIGQAVAHIAKALGMKILAYTRTPKEGAEYADLDTVLSQSDVISLHCPLTPDNAELINETTLSKMKDGAILLNTARGGLVNEQALADSLKSGKLRGAAVDVVSAEPISPDNPLLTAPNCIITPHMAWAPVESRQRIIDCTYRSIQGFLKGQPVNVVNP
jgi:glycerate dehydrogenase